MSIIPVPCYILLSFHVLCTVSFQPTLTTTEEWSKYEIILDNVTLADNLQALENAYPEPTEKGMVLAWELELYFRNNQFGEIAKLLRTHGTSTLLPTVLSNPLGNKHTPLQELLWYWYRTLLAEWPQSTTQPYRTLLLAFLQHNMDPFVSCSFLHTVRYRNHAALSTIIHYMLNTTKTEQVKKEIQMCILSNEYTNIFYLASGTPTAATARLFFRGGQQGLNNASSPMMNDVYATLAYENGVFYNSSMYPIVRKYDLEQASPPIDLDILSPFIPSLHRSVVPPSTSTTSQFTTSPIDEGSEGSDHPIEPPFFSSGMDLDEGFVALPDIFTDPSSSFDSNDRSILPVESVTLLQSLLLEWDPKYHYTPLLNSCRNGRSSVLQYILERILAPSSTNISSSDVDSLPSNFTPFPSSSLHDRQNMYFIGGPLSHGMSCAHLAAAQGYTEIFHVLYRYYNRTDIFLSTDAFGRYPCEYVESHGILHQTLYKRLIDYGVCFSSLTHEPLTVLPLSAYQCPTFGRSETLNHPFVSTLPYFDTFTHVANGWRFLSPVQLEKLALIPNLFTLPTHHHTPTSVFPVINQSVFYRSCPVLELPANILTDQDALNRDYITKNHPFIIRGAYQNFVPYLGGTAAIPSLPKSAILERFGHLVVDTGSLPYADAYGYGKDAKTMEFQEFVNRFMGNERVIPDSLPSWSSIGIDASGSVAQDTSVDTELSILSAFHDGSAFRGPGSNLTNPPYIFDGAILSQEIGQSTIPDFGFPSIFQKEQADRQLIAGPPLSGAMLHFHDAAVNLLVVGVKLWIFIPPSEASFIDAHAHDFWLRYYLPMYVYRNFTTSPYNNVGYTNDTVPWHYVGLQSPGDLVYVPPHWGHAILNLADTVALAYE